MNTSEPTTGEIVRALRYCVGKDTICGTACPAYSSEAGCRTTIMKNAADRLESQERELSGITGELEQYKKWHDESIATATNNIVELEHRVAALTARAEQAEARERAAVNKAVRAVFYDTSNGKRGLLVDAGICDYCQSDKGERIKCESCFENGNFELRDNLRGLPQEGEGK